MSKVELSPYRAIFEQIANTNEIGIKEIQSLIIVHEHFTPSTDFFRSFAEVFYAVGNNEIAIMRMLGFLKRWIIVDRVKFLNKSELGDTLSQFLAQIPETPLKTLLITTLNDKEESDLLDALTFQNDPFNSLNHYDVIFSYDRNIICEQLTLFDQLLMRQVDKSELLHSNFVKGDKSPGIDRCGRHASALTYWTSMQILTAPRSKIRMKKLVNLLLLCESLMKFKNYQSLMSIYLGLELITTKYDFYPLLPNLEYVELWEEIETVLDNKNNFRNYRNKVKELRDSQYIPVLEVFLKDIAFHDESTSNFDHDEKSLVNKDKVFLLGGTVNRFFVSTRYDYEISVVSELQSVFATLPVFGADEVGRTPLNRRKYITEIQVTEPDDNLSPRKKKTFNNNNKKKQQGRPGGNSPTNNNTNYNTASFEPDNSSSPQLDSSDHSTTSSVTHESSSKKSVDSPLNSPHTILRESKEKDNVEKKENKEDHSNSHTNSPKPNKSSSATLSSSGSSGGNKKGFIASKLFSK